MKIFVAGATGVLGRRAVGRLVEAGHEVTAVARTPGKADLVRSLGAAPVTVDLFDASAVLDAVAGHEVVCNLATHIPPLNKAAIPSSWAENDRIRTEGARNLVDAAIAAHAGRYVQESLAFIYADGGDAWLDEDAPQSTSPVLASVQAAESEAARFTAAGGVGVVLRFSMFYGADAFHTQGQLKAARQGVAPVVGRPDAYQAMLHLDDAATAVVAALDAPAGAYNVAEDRPGTHADQAAAMAEALGLAPLWLAPAATARAGGSKNAYLSSSQRVSNRRFREATGWAPAYPSPWEGWAQVTKEAGLAPTPGTDPDRGLRVLVRAALAVLAVNAASLGLWATFAPRSWYDGFPGAGRHWVSADGPYNQHLVRDVGGFSLALLVLTFVALGSRSRALVRTAGIAWFVSALPHLLYHIGHRGVLSAGDQVASLGGLALQVVLAVVCVFAAPPTRPRVTAQRDAAAVPAAVVAV